MNTRVRVIRIILLLLARPSTYSRRELAELYHVGKTTIDDDIKFIIAAGLDFRQDFQNKCSIIPDRTFKELEYLMPLTQEEQATISRAIDSTIGNAARASSLKRKVVSLYDFQKLGLRALRRPEIEKLDKLEAAKKNEQQVMLEQYRSNSNKIKDRYIEAFNINTEHGTIQAYDVEEKTVKHFKLNRFDRVHLTDIKWQYSKHHDPKYTDIFRIANNKREPVELILDVYAYNALMENYPNARSHITIGGEPNTFHFQGEINADFLGLTNFILGNRGHVEILSCLLYTSPSPRD